MLRWIDGLLNRITMYRLVLYYLIFLLGAALVLSVTGGLSYDPTALLLSISFLLAACAATNWIFARTFGVPSNVESTYISALILALIITPLQSYNDLWFLGWASVIAMASKYILGIRGKHLFNPVALAAALTYFTINQSASWWVGNATLLPFVLVGGVLIVMKIRRFDMVVSFLLTALIAILLAALFGGGDLFASLQRTLLYSPIAFFAFVLLTEPLTTPPTHKLRIFYGALVGLLFTPLLHIGSFYTTPELALLIGNLYSYIVSPKTRLVLKLKGKTRIAPDTYEFVFGLPRRIAFAPGQYMEWTLGHDDPDSRGNRRYFTLASAPTEHDVRLGVKFYQKPSSFKKALVAMGSGYEIVASQLAGDFVLPNDLQQKIILIAGGIGVTPFRSMIKYLLDTRQHRPILLFYANRRFEDIVYKDIFDRAERELGIHTIYTVEDPTSLPPNWRGVVGRITPQLISQAVPNFNEFIFYISGPIGMINFLRDTLHQLGVKDSQIKVDYFAGLA
jgi:ferredoxin-NADP reductase/Na+-translocating ferredoxin:NAD+ oxidoreductase RnfD subunit